VLLWSQSKDEIYQWKKHCQLKIKPQSITLLIYILLKSSIIRIIRTAVFSILTLKYLKAKEIKAGKPMKGNLHKKVVQNKLKDHKHGDYSEKLGQ